MWTEITIPAALYLAWPWLCLAMALGYFSIGMPIMATNLLMYGGWVFWRRSRIMGHLRRAQWQHQRRERTNHGI